MPGVLKRFTARDLLNCIFDRKTNNLDEDLFDKTIYIKKALCVYFKCVEYNIGYLTDFLSFPPIEPILI